VWRKALEGCNMDQSKQVLEWQKIAEKRGKKLGELRALRNVLQRLLRKRFGPLPAALIARINATNNLGVLEAAVEQTLDLKTLDELRL
jgi:hypothetical protein